MFFCVYKSELRAMIYLDMAEARELRIIYWRDCIYFLSLSRSRPSSEHLRITRKLIRT